MSQVEVFLAWESTGQICNDNAERHTGSGDFIKHFNSFELAEKYCRDVLMRFPFLECHIQALDETESKILRSDVHVGKVFQLNPKDSTYRVRLFEWISSANVSSDGNYLSEQAEEIIPEFETYRKAKQYAKALMNKHNNIEAWIYGPDGIIMNRGGSEVILHESGGYTVPLRWWQSLFRDYNLSKKA